MKGRVIREMPGLRCAWLPCGSFRWFLQYAPTSSVRCLICASIIQRMMWLRGPQGTGFLMRLWTARRWSNRICCWERAVEHARSGKGPYLVEYKTFRMALHFSGDPGGYVKPEDLEKWRKRDPIDLCQKKILDLKIFTAGSGSESQKGSSGRG